MRGCWGVNAEADAGFDLAGGDGVRIYREPETQILLKPNVTREAAKEYGFAFRYSSRPGWERSASLLEFADVVRRDLREMRPRDLINIQSFIWVLGSNEY